jgi:hypothetical protein
MGLGRSDGAATYEEGRSSRHGLGLVGEKWACWGPRVPGPIRGPPSGFAICLIVKALFSPRRAFAQSERSHRPAVFSLHRAFAKSERSYRPASAVERYSVREAPPCDRESIGVAWALPCKKCAAAVLVACSWCRILRPAQGEVGVQSVVDGLLTVAPC